MSVAGVRSRVRVVEFGSYYTLFGMTLLLDEIRLT